MCLVSLQAAAGGIHTADSCAIGVDRDDGDEPSAAAAPCGTASHAKEQACAPCTSTAAAQDGPRYEQAARGAPVHPAHVPGRVQRERIRIGPV
mgnify:CR=1 FL=1